MMDHYGEVHCLNWTSACPKDCPPGRLAADFNEHPQDFDREELIWRSCKSEEVCGAAIERDVLKKRQMELRQDLGELQRYRNTGLSPEEVERLVAPMVCIIGELDEEGRKKIEASRVVHLKPADPLEAFYTGWVDVRNAVPSVGLPVLIARRKHYGCKLMVAEGTLMPDGRWESWVNPASFRLSDCEKLGKTVFLTEGEARNALARIEEVT